MKIHHYVKEIIDSIPVKATKEVLIDYLHSNPDRVKFLSENPVPPQYRIADECLDEKGIAVFTHYIFNSLKVRIKAHHRELDNQELSLLYFSAVVSFMAIRDDNSKLVDSVLVEADALRNYVKSMFNGYCTTICYRVANIIEQSHPDFSAADDVSQLFKDAVFDALNCHKIRVCPKV